MRVLSQYYKFNIAEVTQNQHSGVKDIYVLSYANNALHRFFVISATTNAFALEKCDHKFQYQRLKNVTSPSEQIYVNLKSTCVLDFEYL